MWVQVSCYFRSLLTDELQNISMFGNKTTTASPSGEWCINDLKRILCAASTKVSIVYSIETVTLIATNTVRGQRLHGPGPHHVLGPQAPNCSHYNSYGPQLCLASESYKTITSRRHWIEQNQGTCSLCLYADGDRNYCWLWQDHWRIHRGGGRWGDRPPYGLKKNIFFSLFLLFITEKIVNFLS